MNSNETKYKYIQEINDTNIEKFNITNNIEYNFNDGAYIKIKPECPYNFNIKLINSENNLLEYNTTLKPNMWGKSMKKYYIDWNLNIEGVNINQDLTNKKVLIIFESKALGDTLAWIPYVEEFRKKHNCILYCSTFHNYMFEKTYSNIRFITPGFKIESYAQYKLGWFYNNNTFDKQYHPQDFIKIPLQQTASDILGLKYKEIKPNIDLTLEKTKKPKNKYFTFSMQSTAQAKYWNYPKGWYKLLNMLKRLGYEGVCIDKFKSFGIPGNFNEIPKNCIDKTNLSLNKIGYLIQNAEFHIGLSSGISWLAWALNKHTYLISGFSDPLTEFTSNCSRITPVMKDICTGCFNKHKFDAKDWMWCPINKNTDKMFECSKSITPQQVYNTILKQIKNG